MNKTITTLSIAFVLGAFAYCGGGKPESAATEDEQPLKSAPASAISADNALDEADRILEDIENL